MFRQRAETRLIVLRDTDTARAALRRALDTAEPVDAPGLRRALALLGEGERTDQEITRDWTLQILRDAGVDPKDEVVAVRALRQAQPTLDLRTAVDLVKGAGRR